ncbi:MAG TPA: hypothetical protein VK178_05065 [Opitutaceae bacterium]|nr:hypothetical protein [Opitutaceae bacterium]
MSVRYEIPESTDTDKPKSEEDLRLEAIARKASITDPAFHNWRWWYWAGVRTATALVFCVSVVGMLVLFREEPTEDHRSSRFNRLIVYVPVLLASGVYGAGSWYFRRKLRVLANLDGTDTPKEKSA